MLKKEFNKWIPNEIRLWLSKEGFNEALERIEFFRDIAGKLILGKKFAEHIKLFPWNSSQSKEEFLYKAVLNGYFDKHIQNNKLFFLINEKF